MSDATPTWNPAVSWGITNLLDAIATHCDGAFCPTPVLEAARELSNVWTNDPHNDKSFYLDAPNA